MSRRKLRWIARVWITSLVVFSLQPNRFVATRQGTSAHPVAHILAFGIAAALLLVLGRSRGQQWISALSLVGLATAIEAAQFLIYHGALEWWDIGSDTVGIAIARLLNAISPS
jgi:hypothetical protein